MCGNSFAFTRVMRFVLTTILVLVWPSLAMGRDLGFLEFNVAIGGGTFTESFGCKERSMSSGVAELGIAFVPREIGFYPEIVFQGLSAEPLDERRMHHPLTDVTMDSDTVHARYHYRYKHARVHLGLGLGQWRQEHMIEPGKYVHSQYSMTIPSAGADFALYESDDGIRVSIYYQAQRHHMYLAGVDEPQVSLQENRTALMQIAGLSVLIPLGAETSANYNSPESPAGGFYMYGLPSLEFARIGLELSKVLFTAISHIH